MKKNFVHSWNYVWNMGHEMQQLYIRIYSPHPILFLLHFLYNCIIARLFSPIVRMFESLITCLPRQFSRQFQNNGLLKLYCRWAAFEFGMRLQSIGEIEFSTINELKTQSKIVFKSFKANVGNTIIIVRVNNNLTIFDCFVIMYDFWEIFEDQIIQCSESVYTMNYNGEK